MRKVRIGRGGGGVSEFGGASEVDIEAGGSEAELGLGAETQVDSYCLKMLKNENNCSNQKDTFIGKK